LQWWFRAAQDGTFSIQDSYSNDYLGYPPSEPIAFVNLQALEQPTYWNVTVSDASPNPPTDSYFQLFVPNTPLAVTLVNQDDGELTLVLDNASKESLQAQSWVITG